jgi:F5/8 type C domain
MQLESAWSVRTCLRRLCFSIPAAHLWLLALGLPQVSTSAAAGGLSRAGWVVSALVGGSPGNAIDGNIATRWTTGVSQTNGEWFQVDMGGGTPPTFTNIVLDAGSSTGDYPRGYRVNVSNDGTNWGSPVATGAGSSAVTSISFSARAARYLRITQPGSNGLWWSIHELNIYGTPPTSPDSLVAVPGTNQVALTWLSPTGATSYNVKRATNAAGPYAIIATPTVANYAIPNALIGRHFFYVVSALNSVGESGDCSPVYAAALPQSVLAQSFVQGGAFSVVTTVAEGQTYVLEARTNLILGSTWAAVVTNTALANGPLILTDASAGTNQGCFYRLRYQ